MRVLADAIGTAGYAVVTEVLNPAATAALADAVAAVGDAGNARNLLGVTAVAAVAASPAVRALVDPVVGPDARPVRGILFDKTATTNWKVPWHQDTAIAVRCRIDAPGYGPWSVKAGVPHVRPPAAILERMLTVRLHVDDCGLDNGPLRVLPGSHAGGLLGEDDIRRWRWTTAEVATVVGRGGAVVMRPLILHASSSAAVPSRRRVVHLEFAAAGPLPGGLEWHAA